MYLLYKLELKTKYLILQAWSSSEQYFKIHILPHIKQYSWLMLSMETIAVYSENHIKPINIFYGEIKSVLTLNDCFIK
jgi:hypothetical protein